MINLTIFNNNLFEAGTEFFNQLGIRLNSNTASSLGAKELLKDNYKDKGIFKAIAETYFLGLVDDSVFDGSTPLLNKEKISIEEAEDKINSEYNGLMVFAVWLKDSYSPTRGEIAELTRAFNRASKNVPVVLLLKYGGLLSFAASERTKYKQAYREGEKIGKISLLKDINIDKPHTGHLKILDDLKVAPAVGDFNALNKQWQEVFNVQLLNEKFYQELANWYFWALRNVEFPEDAEKNKDVRNAISVIRMITRLIFIWFVKEKGLIPDELFNQAKLKSLLNLIDKNQSTYYKAILQNLFFATLNTEMNKDKPGSRKFRGKNKSDGRDQHYMIHNVFRYEDYFTNPQDTLKKYFENIPFLNGGLFECLDKEIVGADLRVCPNPEHTKQGAHTGAPLQKKIIRIDGFSDHPKNGLNVPDYLFFSSEQPVDLNEVYGTKNKTYKVRGLINILDSYKFTVDENTPIEEEIALDPELLGKVFENLLASYNPETQTTARKQTGSFYTPREIVNYMVDESIIAYLANALSSPPLQGGVTEGRGGFIGQPPRQTSSATPPYQGGELIETRLRHLVAYNDDLHKFTSDEVDVLIAAINTLKALDPACGSGAFPMGMLHKLVYILGKLDPDNSKWREVQRQKAIRETEEAYNIGDKEEREKRLLDISEVFENNASDYGRKLYLIENCIFGVDIQPIAVQIAKLRFFVSLIVDQRIDPKKENLGVRPLPNLETKFVAANTLIGIEKPEQMLLRNPEIDKKEKELKEVRERHFTARTPQTKEKYRKEDERLRAEISELLKKDGFPRETTERLAKWNPYDQNAFADFFDPEWMFGITEGFDVVIGNPPFVRKIEEIFKRYLMQKYKTANYQVDLYVIFIEQSVALANQEGVVSLITPNSWLKNLMMIKLRKHLLNNVSILTLAPNIAGAFDASVDTSFFVAQKRNNLCQKTRIMRITQDGIIESHSVSQSDFNHTANNVFEVEAMGSAKNIIEKIRIGEETISSLYDVCRGINPYDALTGQSQEIIKSRAYHADYKKDKTFVPELKGKHVHPFQYEWDGKHYISYGSWLAAPRETKYFKGERIVFREILSKRLVCTLITEEFKIDRSLYIALPKPKSPANNYYVIGLLTSKLFAFYFRYTSNEFDKIFPKVRVAEFKALPIKLSNGNDQKRIIDIVCQILAAKKKDPSADTSALEKQLDEMVYAVYGLTPEEIAIVEGKK